MAAEIGDIVKVHYTGLLDNGNQFDSSIGSNPMEFKIGEGSLLEDFENAVIGMNPGESKTIKISPEDGYGLKRQDLIFTLPRNKMPSNMHPEVGHKLQMKTQEGGNIVFNVIEITPETVKVDANHELAGENLTFSIELIEIV